MRLPLLVLVRTAFGMILRNLGNGKRILLKLSVIINHSLLADSFNSLLSLITFFKPHFFLHLD